MANATTSKVYIVDTSSSTVAVTRDKVAVLMIRWAGNTVGSAYVADVNDNVLWRADHTANSIIETDFSDFPRTAMNWNMNGLMVATLNSGKLYIYLE